VLGLPALPAETAEISKSKFKIKKRLAEYGCNMKGSFFLIHAADELPDAVLPCVVKPSDGSGSKGVSLVHREEDLRDAVQYAFDSARFGEVYVESYIRGAEYSVEAFVAQGDIYIYAIVKTTFDRTVEGEISYGHRVPAGISAEAGQDIAEEVKKAIRGLNITMGSVNFDVIVSADDHKPYIIDCGIRVGQNLIASHFVPLSCGVSVLDNSIALALGQEADAEPKFSRCVATRLLIYRPGRITEIRDMSGIIGRDGVVDIVLRKGVGDVQGPYRDKSDTCGWVVAMGATPDIAEENAAKAKAYLEDYIIIK
jgi:biotin carboxylase